jgi:hypothetical protein
MAVKIPLEYELTPTEVQMGTRWMTLRLKNIGTLPLTALDVRLNSLDAYNLAVYGTGDYVASLDPGEEHLVVFQVMANATTNVYVTAEGWQDGMSFYWESPYIWIRVGEQVAELANLFAMTEPYPPVGEALRCEATVRGMAPSEGLTLEFWANTPSGRFEELASIETKALSLGEEARYAAEITPEEKGSYTIYAYLYDDGRRLDRQTERVYVT